jgi:hypothetical protein
MSGRKIMPVRQWLRYLSCLVVMLLPVTALADEAMEHHHRGYVGVGGGLGLVTYGTEGSDSTVKFSSKSGFTAGIVAGWRLTDMLAIQIESAFSTKGVKSAVNGSPYGVFSRHYVEFPLLLKFVAPLSGRIAPHASLGPAPGILLQAETELADGRHIDLTDRTERIDLGIMVGAGASFEVGAFGAVYFDARYNHGVLNTNKIATSEDTETTNRAFYVTVGYQTDLSVFSGGQ